MDHPPPGRRWRTFPDWIGALALGAVLCGVGLSAGCDSHRNGPMTSSAEALDQADDAPDRDSTAMDSNAEAPADSTNDQRSLTGLESDHTSAESLSRAVLKALKDKDEEELTRLRVTRREYSELLFPHFDAAKPPRNIPADFHWKLLDAKSVVGAREALQRYGGQEFELLEVLPQGVDEYPTFRLLRKVRLKLRRVSDGAVDTVTIFGSIVEMDSRYKLLSFPS